MKIPWAEDLKFLMYISGESGLGSYEQSLSKEKLMIETYFPASTKGVSVAH